MRVGVHTSVKKGFTGALQEAVDLGCTSFQMFTQSPRGWRTRVYTDDEFAEFRVQRQKSGIDPVVVHTPYLPNLCTSDLRLYQQSKDSLKADLERCQKLEADYLVIHPGAYSPDKDFETGLSQITNAFNEVLCKDKGKTRVLIETMAGGGRRIGGTFDEMAQMLDGVKCKDRMGVCFDTCHIFAAGYDIRTSKSAEAVLNEFDKKVGLEKIFVFHVNDSRDPLESHRDRHEHLGKGSVGLKGLKSVLSQKTFKDCAFILETPKDTPEADPQNLKLLRECLD